jgi:serine/threonine protein kinase
MRLGRPVQVTLLPAGAAPGQERYLHDEVRRLANLSHPGLVTVHDSGVEGRQVFLVTELIDGEPLSELLARHPLPPEEVTSAGAQLADALAYLHHQGIVHGDIRPSAVLMGWDGRVYLTGFGLPGLTDATRPMPADATAYLTLEEARGFDPGPAGDVFALGTALLQCVTGSAREPGGAHQAATSLAPAVPAGLPIPLGRALTAMTRPDPAQRPTAAQCAAMLGDPDEPRGRADDPPPRRSNALRNWAIGGGLFLLAVVIGVILLNRDADEAGEPAPPPAVDAPPAGDRPAVPDLPDLPDVTGVPDVGVPDVDVPDIEIPKPPSELPDLPDVPEAPNADDLFTRIQEWFRSWS